MKRMIMFFGWMLIVCTAASGQTRFLEQVDWGTPSVVKQGEKVRVKVDIRLDEMRLKDSAGIAPRAGYRFGGWFAGSGLAAGGDRGPGAFPGDGA